MLHVRPAHLVELEELMLLLEGVSGDGGAVAADGVLTKAVVTVRVRPLQDAPAVHHLHSDVILHLKNLMNTMNFGGIG